MRITKHTPKLSNKLPPPELKWQQEDFARWQEYRFHIPYGTLLLCKLWGVTPDELLTDFMDNLSSGSWQREGREEAKRNLRNYALEMGYGQKHYTKEDIEKMFAELESIGMLWPENAKMKFIDMHARWRDKYYNWWFKNWHRKYRRKL